MFGFFHNLKKLDLNLSNCFKEKGEKQEEIFLNSLKPLR